MSIVGGNCNPSIVPGLPLGTPQRDQKQPLLSWEHSFHILGSLPRSSQRETVPSLVRMQPSAGKRKRRLHSHQGGDSLSLARSRQRAQNVNYSAAPNLVMVASNHATVIYALIIPLQSDIDLIYPLISGGISGDIPPAPDIPLASFYTVYSPLHCCQHVIFFFSTILSGSRWRLGQKKTSEFSPLSVLSKSRGASTERNRNPGKFTSWTVFSKVYTPQD